MVMGDALRSFNGLVRPLFSFPKATKHCDRRRVKKGAGSHFEKNGGGVQAGQPRRRGSVSDRDEIKKQSHLQ